MLEQIFYMVFLKFWIIYILFANTVHEAKLIFILLTLIYTAMKLVDKNNK